jgi:uncharacterized protein YodC (DUF2158 family)
MDSCFSIGEKVRMKNGSPDMTVVRIIGSEKEDRFVFIDRLGYESGDVICEWFDGNNHKQDIFRKTALKHI